MAAGLLCRRCAGPGLRLIFRHFAASATCGARRCWRAATSFTSRIHGHLATQPPYGVCVRLAVSRMTVGSPAKKQHYQASGPRCLTWLAAQVLRPRLFSLPESLLRVKPFLHNPLASLRAVLLQPRRWPCLLTLKRPGVT